MNAIFKIFAFLFIFNNFANINASELRGSFVTLVDHFNPQDHQNVRFPYEYNLDYYDGNGPLFFYINDGLSYTNEWIKNGLVVDVAKKVKAALFTTDHRYFRFNLPTKTVSYDDLRYLNVEQNLADINTFINNIKEELNVTNTKVFVWGTGYGGLLATLARQKYPNSINVVWSSNGVIDPVVFNENYFQQLEKNIREIGGENCFNRLSHAFQQIETELNSLNDTLLVKEFSVCRPWNISKTEDAALFIDGLLNFIDQHIQANQEKGVVDFCSSLNSNLPDPLKSLARWIRYENYGDLYRCFNYDYEGKKKWLSDVDWHLPGTSTGLRQWYYLQCTELGQFRTLTSESVFGHRLNEAFYYKLCSDSFGPKFNFERLFDTVDLFRWLYGGKEPRITNALFTNGNLDGFINEAITEYDDQRGVVINIAHTSKNADLASIHTYDSASLYFAKTTTFAIIEKWTTQD